MKILFWTLLLLTQLAYGGVRTCKDDALWRNMGAGVWVWTPQAQGDISRRNQGHVLATSVIVDGGEAMVIDPGPSHRHGERTLAWVRCRWQSEVKWVINTHAHAENVLGNSAFKQKQSAGRLLEKTPLSPSCQHDLFQRRDPIKTSLVGLGFGERHNPRPCHIVT